MTGGKRIHHAGRGARVQTSPERGRQVRNLVFVTGTDTGVGKTVLTGLLLCHLRRNGCRALAVKPFCSGDRADVRLLKGCQDGELSCDEINPFFCLDPIAPGVSKTSSVSGTSLSEACAFLKAMALRCDWLLVEGCGGLMVPLANGFLVEDYIAAMMPHVVVVGANRLGTINHSLLTINALRARGVVGVTLVLMQHTQVDASCSSNREALLRLVSGTTVFEVPFLDESPSDVPCLQMHSKKLKKVLARVWASATVAPL